MGVGPVTNSHADGDVLLAVHINELASADIQDFVPRNALGLAQDLAGDLGQITLRWKKLWVKAIDLDGVLLDPSSFGVDKDDFQIDSGRVRTASQQPDFLRAAGGASASFTILAAVVPLNLTIDSVSVVCDIDVVKSGLTLAPSTNNTCLVNDTAMTSQIWTKYVGEQGGGIPIDTAGTEITNRVGQYAAFKNGTEIMVGYIESTTLIKNIYRGWCFDSTGNPIVRGTLADNASLTLLNIGWVFVENETTVDVSYRTPFTGSAQPASPQNGDYWFDTINRKWKRYSSGTATFDIVARHLVGIAILDTAGCIATRSFDFFKNYSGDITFDVLLNSTTVAVTDQTLTLINVMGNRIQTPYNKQQWIMPTNLESGLSEAASTLYYLYMTEKGQSIISIERPQIYPYRKGYYHPYHSWRFVGVAFNDASSNFTYVDSNNIGGIKTYKFETAGVNKFYLLPNCYPIEADLTAGGGAAGGVNVGGSGGWPGGGGGGGRGIWQIPQGFSGYFKSEYDATVGAGGTGNNGNGNTGGTSSLDTLVTATGGAGASGVSVGGGITQGGSGGIGQGAGNLRMRGENGGPGVVSSAGGYGGASPVSDRTAGRTSSGSGNTGNPYGGGGGGPYETGSTDRNGGNGAPGVVFVKVLGLLNFR